MEDWKTYSFKEIASLSKGKYNPKKENLDLPCIELEHLESETGRLLGYTSSLLQSSTKNRFKPGDILYGKLRPYLRKYYFPNFEGVCSSEIWVLKNEKQKVYNKYLYYVIQTNRFNQNANKSSGTKMPRADWDFVSETVFPIPPFNEQYKIASILSTWDKAIELKEKLIEQKKEQKKGLMQKLLTGEVRLAGRRETIKHLKLKGLIKEINERNTKNKITNVLSVTNSNGFILQSEQFGRQIASKDLSNYKIVRKEQFAYNPSRVNVGSIDLLKNFDVGILSPMYVIFETIEEKLLPNYLYHFLKSNLFLNQLDGLLQGSVRQSLNFKSLEQVKLFVPDLTEQREISEFLDLFDEQLSLLQLELDNLQEQKKGLMQLLLTGKVRVKV